MKLRTLVSFTTLAAVGLAIGACSQNDGTVGMHPEAHTTIVAEHSGASRVADHSLLCKRAPCAGDQT